MNIFEMKDGNLLKKVIKPIMENRYSNEEMIVGKEIVRGVLGKDNM